MNRIGWSEVSQNSSIFVMEVAGEVFQKVFKNWGIFINDLLCLQRKLMTGPSFWVLAWEALLCLYLSS
jgi:hypothetical protein